MILVGLLGSFYGVVNGNPGAVAVLTVQVIYPLIYLILALAYRSSDSEKLLKLLLVSAVSVGVLLTLYSLLTVIMPGNLLSQFLSARYADKAVVDEGRGEYFKFTLSTVTSILFLLPFCIGVFSANSVIGFGHWSELLLCSFLPFFPDAEESLLPLSQG